MTPREYSAARSKFFDISEELLLENVVEFASMAKNALDDLCAATSRVEAMHAVDAAI